MAWQWALIIGGVIMPWALMGRTILMGFRERGLQTGLGAWFGIAIPCTLVMLVLFWIQDAFFKG